MISRIARSKQFLRTVFEVKTNQRLSRGILTSQKRRIFQGYVSHTPNGNSLNACDINSGFKSPNAYYSSETKNTYKPELELNSVQFEKISTDTLESLTEYFDELIEKAAHLEDADVSYGDGVLTVKFGKREGTYVINRQTPNKQIWLSSPKSGPKRYDFLDGKWIYKHDGKTLHDLLNREIPAIIRSQATFEKCSYSGMEQYSDRGSSNSLTD